MSRTDRPPSHRVSDSAHALRRLLGVVLALAMFGVGAELVLIEHDEDWQQLVPLVALGVALLAYLWDARARRGASLTVFRVAMLCLMATAIAGLYLHYESNEEFQREMDPSLDGWQLMLATLRCSSPPSLAPATFGLLGAIGWLATYGRTRTTTSSSGRSTS
jgi:hypothetical protein